MPDVIDFLRKGNITDAHARPFPKRRLKRQLPQPPSVNLQPRTRRRVDCFGKLASESGIRGYRTNGRTAPGNPDVVFTRHRLAVFVKACYWNGCSKCFREHRADRSYWTMKTQRNRDRDEQVSKECKSSGWQVVRIWEHEIRKNADKAAQKIIRNLTKLGLNS